MHALILIEVAGLAVLLWYALCSLNRMGRATHCGIKWSATVATVGAFWRLLLLCSGGVVPDIGNAMLVIGLAAGLIFNRRRRASSCPCNHVSVPAPQRQKEGRHGHA